MFRTHPLFSAAGTPSAGNDAQRLIDEANARNGIVAGGKPGVTLTLEQYNELVGMKSELTTLKTQVQQQSELADAVKALYAGNDLPEATAKNHMRKLLVHAGLSGEKLESNLNNAFVSANPEPEDPAADPNAANTGRGAAQGNGKPPVTQQQPAAPAKPSMQDLALRQMVNSRVKAAAKAAVEAAPGYLKAVEVIKGRYTDPKIAEAKVKRFASEHLKRAEDMISAAVVKRRDQENTLNLDWIEEAGNDVTKETADAIELVFGDPNQIGRAPGVTEDEPFDVATQKPVEFAGFDENSGTVDNDNFDDHATDRIMRGLAEAGSRAGGPGVL